MNDDDPASSREQIMDAMIHLAGIAKAHRIIVGGSEDLQIYLELHSRGYARVATVATCRVPCGQHDVGLVPVITRCMPWKRSWCASYGS